MNKNMKQLAIAILFTSILNMCAQEAQFGATVEQVKTTIGQAKEALQAWASEAGQNWQKIKQDLQDAQVEIELLISTAQQKLDEAQNWINSRLNVATTPQDKIAAISEELRMRVVVIDNYIRSVELLSKSIKVLDPELYATTQQLIVALRSSNEFLTTLADRLNGIVTALQNKGN